MKQFITIWTAKSCPEDNGGRWSPLLLDSAIAEAVRIAHRDNLKTDVLLDTVDDAGIAVKSIALAVIHGGRIAKLSAQLTTKTGGN